jgi:peptidoglycan/LPS O-acetylase OafA/YrhL
MVPGLLLTLFWDSLGMRLFPSHFAYTGAPQTWINDFYPVAERSTAAIFFANLGFMHAINGIPPFGTAAQLWSLTYEFAYYLIFPAALLAVWPRTRSSMRVVYAVVAVALSYRFGTTILLRFPIWLLGFGVRAVPRLPPLERVPPSVRNIGAALFTVAAISATHIGAARQFMGGSLLIADCVVGVVFATGLYVLLHDRRPAVPNAYVRFASASADLSFTLYVFHMSFVIFLRAWLLKGASWSPTVATGAVAALVFVGTVAYAACMYCLAEARTDRVRAFVMGLVTPRNR